MDKLHRLAASHLPILIAAGFLTTLIQAPLFLFPVLEGEAYHGINISHYGTDEHYYLLRAASIARGGSPSDPVLEEGAGAVQANYTFSYAEHILIEPIRWLGLLDSVSIVTIVNTANAIGVFILILLIYSFAFQLSKNKRVALATAVFVVGGYSIVYNKNFFYDDFNIYGRMMFPLMSSFFFFAYLNLLVLCQRTGRRTHTVVAGVIFGSLFFLYYFAWSFSLAATSFLALWYLIKKNKTQAMRVLTILGIGVALGAYNLFHILTYFSSPAGKQSAYFAWTLHTHMPVFSLISVVTLLIFALFFYRIRDRDEIFIALALSLIMAGIVALNEQVITGVLVQYGHYYWYFIVPLSISIAIYCVWSLIVKESHRTIFVVLLVGSAFLNTAVGQYRSYSQTLAAKEYEQRFGPALDILRLDKSSSVVFAADDRNASLVPIYTPHYLFWYTQALEGGASIDRLKEALFTYVYLSKDGRNNFALFLSAELAKGMNGSMYASLFTTFEGLQSGLDYYVYRDKAVAQDPALLAQRVRLLDVLAAEYKTFKDEPHEVENVLKERHVAYILWDKNRYSDWDISFLPATLIEEGGGIALYAIF